MAKQPTDPSPSRTKTPTGIEGLDAITKGGIPRGRTTLIEGGPGCGKTVFALQTLVNGARRYNEPGIFVAFEETAEQIVANASTFGWNLPALQRQKLFFLDAQIGPDFLKAGTFDLGGLLAAVGAKAKQIGARRIVFDAIDVTLTMLNDPVLERREMYRLHAWLLDRKMTAVITSKAHGRNEEQPFGFMHFMVDCAFILKHRVVEGVAQRNVRILKYRGSGFEENEIPLVISTAGIEISGTAADRVPAPVSNKRVSSGIPRLDAMLGGGFHRGSAVLITGNPGTAKSTLCGAFTEAACQRGERVLFVNFDVDGSEAVRNMQSVHIHLGAHVETGLLAMVSARSLAASAEIQLIRIRNLAKAHRARAVVIDPVSALSKPGNEQAAHSVTERLVDWAKAAGLILFCSSLSGSNSGEGEATPLQVSTMADTWIHLSYVVKAGERNRALTIIKSRGTQHSNQVRELILSSGGITLADVYTAGGEVLMGTLRWEKEEAERRAQDEVELAAQHEHARLLAEEAQLEARIRSMQAELDVKRIEKGLVARNASTRTDHRQRSLRRVETLRGADELNGSQDQ